MSERGSAKNRIYDLQVLVEDALIASGVEVYSIADPREQSIKLFITQPVTHNLAEAKKD